MPVAATTKDVLLPAQIVEPDGDVETLGAEFTVPEAATFFVVAPVDEQATLPEGVPDADEVKRT